jgi:hypothetical protein
VIWVVLGVGILFLVIHGQTRIYRTESIRQKCLEMARDPKNVFDTAEAAIRRAATFEKYIREGAPKEKKPKEDDTS